MNNRESCEIFAHENLDECARELIEWKRTALLRDGKVRELARMVSEWAGSAHNLQIAESIIVNAALDVVSV